MNTKRKWIELKYAGGESGYVKPYTIEGLLPCDGQNGEKCEVMLSTGDSALVMQTVAEVRQQMEQE